jgi:hypothetical protein
MACNPECPFADGIDSVAMCNLAGRVIELANEEVHACGLRQLHADPAPLIAAVALSRSALPAGGVR